jgi:hypothetical protein
MRRSLNPGQSYCQSWAIPMTILLINAIIRLPIVKHKLSLKAQTSTAPHAQTVTRAINGQSAYIFILYYLT